MYTPHCVIILVHSVWLFVSMWAYSDIFCTLMYPLLVQYCCPQELGKFGKQCVDLHEDFLISPCLNYDCSDREGEPLIAYYSSKVKELKTIAQVIMYDI